MVIRMILFRKSRKFVYINNKLYYYCIHENNITKIIKKTNENRCFDHFFLVKNLIEVSERLKLKRNKSLAINVMYEYSTALWLRSKNINKNMKKYIFNEACKIVEYYGFNKMIETDIRNTQSSQQANSKEIKMLLNIFKSKSYFQWNLYAVYKLLGIKYGVE